MNFLSKRLLYIISKNEKMPTLKALKARAKSLGFRGYSTMKKAQLIKLIDERPLTKMSMKTLKGEAKRHRIKGFSTMNKFQLVNAISSKRVFKPPLPPRVGSSPVTVTAPAKKKRKARVKKRGPLLAKVRARRDKKCKKYNNLSKMNMKQLQALVMKSKVDSRR